MIIQPVEWQPITGSPRLKRAMLRQARTVDGQPFFEVWQSDGRGQVFRLLSSGWSIASALIEALPC